jgi:twinkle protein
MLNLISSAHWKFAVFSAENKPLRRHAKSLVTRYSGIPWGRISEAEIDFAVSKLSKSLFILDPTDDHLTLDYLLDMTRFLVDREQVDGLILDPWNEIDHSGRGQFQSETEYISQSLTKIRRFARNHDIHIWVVAHPQKLYRDKDGHFPIPGLYDITGSAAWRNKCDFGICVWRDVQNRSKPTEIHVQKVRFSENGKTGDVPLRFDVLTGRYYDLEGSAQDDLPL